VLHRQDSDCVVNEFKARDASLENHVESRGEVLRECAHAVRVGHATRAVNKRVGLTGRARAEYHGGPMIEPMPRHFTQRFKKIRVAPVNEDEPMIHGLPVHSTSRTTTSNPARALKHANLLARSAENLGTG
jgi:hypothetical protein